MTLRLKLTASGSFRLQHSAGAWRRPSAVDADASVGSRHAFLLSEALINVAARMAHWSGRHRKKAIWGWLAFVVIVFAAGNMAGTTQISDVDQFSGESHRAEVALDRAGLRPVEEVVFFQSDKLTIKDPELPGGGDGRDGPPVEDPVRRERDVAAVRRQRDLGRWPRRARGLRDPRRFDRGQGACRAHPRRGRRRPGRPSRHGRRADRRRQRQQGRQRDDHRRPQEGGGALAAGHADHPHHHVRHAGGGRSAAADRDHRRVGRAWAWSRSRAGSCRSMPTSPRSSC